MDTEAPHTGVGAGEGASAPVTWTVWEAVCVFVIWLAATILIGGLTGGRLQDSSQGVLLLFIPHLVLGATTVLWVRARSEDGIRRLLGRRRASLPDVGAGLIYGVVGALVFTFGAGLLLRLLVDALGLRIPPVQEELRQLAAGSAAPLVILVIVILAPIAEELFFRGLLFQALERRLGVWRAAVISAAVFGVVHVEWFVFVITFLFGIYLALIFRRRGTIVTPIVAHMLFNGLGVLLIRTGVG